MVVVDASVAYKWFSPTEENAEVAVGLFKDHITSKNKIIVPDLIIYELANVWSTKTALGVKQIRQNLSDLKEAMLDMEAVTFNFLEKVIEISKKYKISAYDATYIVLAKERKCVLVTADAKLISQVKLPFVKDLANYS